MVCDKEVLDVSEMKHLLKHYREDDEVSKMELIDHLVRKEDLIDSNKTYEENMLTRLKLVRAVINGFILTEE